MCMVIDIAMHRLSSRCVIRYSLILQSRSIPWSSKLASWLKPNFSSLVTDRLSMFNTLRPRRNAQHFADDIFKRIFFNENVWVSFKISLKFVPKGPINNITALVRILAWRGSGDKPLSVPMMANFPTHICATRPQWVNDWLEQIFLLTSKELSLFYMYIFI